MTHPINSAPPSRPRRWWLPPLLALGITGMLAAALLNPARNATIGGPLVGREAPAFTLSTLDGTALALQTFQGRPVVLNFWASWCVPCRDEAPLFRELAARPSGKPGLVLLGILFQEPSDVAARNFIREYALAYPSVRDPNSKTAINYGVSGIPETFFIDAQGVIQFVDRGGLTRERLNAGLEKIGVPPL
ncbi:TlpA disulfide reductase family protein [Deinococcus aquatilis]|uniref:TlpA disulfide reductase family protein n=1 Tax=Deinococcus aquatilis TaxID=519440 RepID=UPI00037719D1|nr:TlpA disulfide reductase family protein [Deinococcus aquatilis]